MEYFLLAMLIGCAIGLIWQFFSPPEPIDYSAFPWLLEIEERRRQDMLARARQYQQDIDDLIARNKAKAKACGGGGRRGARQGG